MTFEVFWRHYPRKDGKKYALKCYDRAVKKHGAQRIIDGLTSWNKVRRDCDPKFIPHASTWLNQERFMDDFEEMAKPVKPEGSKRRVWVNNRAYSFIDALELRRQKNNSPWPLTDEEQQVVDAYFGGSS